MNIEIEIGGKRYPCRQTMGAMLRFRDETGRDITEMGGSFTEVCTYLWCCVASACKADGVEFGYTLLDFADNLTPDVVSQWSQSLTAVGGETGGEKKKA